VTPLPGVIAEPAGERNSSGIRRFRMFAGALMLIVACLCFLILRHLGDWLVIDEPLRKSSAIVVLGGGVPFRAMEAASLYRAGWGGELWLSRSTPDAGDVAMAELGFEPNQESDTNRLILEKLGVPENAIHVLPDPVDNTLTELRAVLAFAQTRPPGPIILVSSKTHTKRLRVIWNKIAAPGRIAIVRFTPRDTFDPARWWATTTDALTAFRDTFGILNAWAGFPIAPRER
jgi:hypothetical protein